jgi:hypothetical protein
MSHHFFDVVARCFFLLLLVWNIVVYDTQGRDENEKEEKREGKEGREKKNIGLYYNSINVEWKYNKEANSTEKKENKISSL